MDPASSSSELTCLLERPDGTVWHVTDLDLKDAVPSVSARRREPIEADGNEVPTLTGEPLARGDRLEWRNAEGEVVWALRSPLGPTV